MSKKVIFAITKDEETKSFSCEIDVKPIELAATFCALMESDLNFRQVVVIATKVFFDKPFKSPPLVEKPFAEA